MRFKPLQTGSRLSWSSLTRISAALGRLGGGAVTFGGPHRDHTRTRFGDFYGQRHRSLQAIRSNIALPSITVNVGEQLGQQKMIEATRWRRAQNYIAQGKKAQARKDL